MFFNPKVMLKNIPIPAILGNEVYQVKVKGKQLTESQISNSLPVLGIVAINASANNIKVLLNGFSDTSFDVPAGTSAPLSGIPCTDIVISNEGVADIAAGAVSLILINDMAECLRFYEARKLGVVPYD